MIYKKTQPEIEYLDFFNLLRSVKCFSSLQGMQYEVIGSVMSFVRKSSGKQWEMELKRVHQTYLELENFKTYVSRTHSPALGLLLHLRLLKKQNRISVNI